MTGLGNEPFGERAATLSADPLLQSAKSTGSLQTKGSVLEAVF